MLEGPLCKPERDYLEFRDLKQKRAILKLILKCTGSQCRSFKIGVILDDLEALATSLAVLFWTH